MIYDDPTKKIMEKERDILRNELLKLKDCQVRYFWSAITATGVMIGIGIKIGTKDMIGLFFMAPLFIIVPCWLIFFDKATTITRIVGYLKVLEYMLINKGESKYHYIGWENALHLFRQQPQKGERPSMLIRFGRYIWDFIVGIVLIFKFEVRTRYWCISWLTFIILSLICYIYGWRNSDSNDINVYIFGFFLGIATVHNSYILKNLIAKNGKFSYIEKWNMWKIVLSSDNASNYYNNNYATAISE